MANTPRLFEDLSRVASGAMGTVVGMRDEAEAQLRQRLERVLERMDVVPREEFEVVRAMAARARDEQEAMAARLAALEGRLAELEKGAPTGPAAGSPAPKSSAAKPSRKRASAKGGPTAGRTASAKSDAKGGAAKGSTRARAGAKGGTKAPVGGGN